MGFRKVIWGEIIYIFKVVMLKGGVFFFFDGFFGFLRFVEEI